VRDRLRVKRRGVSSIIAELLLIVITVSIGTLVYGFASTAFGGFGAGFSNLVQGAGSQLAENVVIEQVYFITATNSTSCPVACGDLFLRNVGANTVTIQAIYLIDITADLPNGTATCNNPSPPPFTPPPKEQVCYNTYTGLTDIYNNQLSALSLSPTQGVMVRFNFGVAPHPGNVYSFTIVTGRGNQFVGYEKV
jgi:flagellin-like protein